MKCGDFQLFIPFADLEQYGDPTTHKKWSQVESDVRITLTCPSGKNLQAKEFTCTFWFWCEGDEVELEPSNAECNPNGAATVLHKTQVLVPGTYYIAITDEMAEEVAHHNN